MKICFITSVFGNRKSFKPGMFKRDKNYDYLMFVDNDNVDQSSTAWDIIDISSNPVIENLNCSIRRSRYPKFMGWQLLETLDMNYDYIYYCDHHFSPSPDADWYQVCEHLKNKQFPFHSDEHEKYGCRKNGISKELYLIVRTRKETKESAEKTKNFLHRTYPEVDQSTGPFYQNTMFGYKADNVLIRDVCTEFWKHYSTQDITYRDQPLWNAIIRHRNLTPFSDVKLKGNIFKQTGKYGHHKYV